MDESLYECLEYVNEATEYLLEHICDGNEQGALAWIFHCYVAFKKIDRDVKGTANMDSTFRRLYYIEVRKLMFLVEEFKKMESTIVRDSWIESALKHKNVALLRSLVN